LCCFTTTWKKGAKTTINNEFKIPNQVAGTSVSVEQTLCPTPRTIWVITKLRIR
jgi:hypothetical protein